MIKSILYIIIICILTVNIYPQRMLKLSVKNGGKESQVSYVARKNIVYVSAIELASALNANHYLNSKSAKVELKFTDYNLKFTAANQFAVLISRKDNLQEILQIPLSTLYIGSDIFIPIQYTSNLLERAMGGKIVFDSGKKHIDVFGGTVSPPVVVGVEDIDAESGYRPPLVAKETVNSPYDIYDLTIDEKSNGTLIRLKSQKKITKQPRSSIKDGKLYLYLTGVTFDLQNIKSTKTAGLVRTVEFKDIAGNSQLEFKLKEGYSSHETFLDIDNNDILITIHNKKFERTENPVVDNMKKWEFDVVVIDAGHGGKDPGAIGITGVREKDINLAIALKLGKMIEQNMSDVKVVYTRDDDTFVELYKRGKIANENNGKLFISIHCNSLGKGSDGVRGFEVYLLRPGRTKKAIEIAEFENSVIRFEENPDRYQELTDENFILVSMAHSQYMRFSEKFSELLFNDWHRSVGIPARGIRQAGFYVLVGASMPGVLVESGYISNKQDEAYLKSSSGQTAVAESIYNSLVEYRNYYNQEFENTGG